LVPGSPAASGSLLTILNPNGGSQAKFTVSQESIPADGTLGAVNTGIGCSNPESKLHVGGNIRIGSEESLADSETSYNISLGSDNTRDAGWINLNLRNHATGGDVNIDADDLIKIRRRDPSTTTATDILVTSLKTASGRVIGVGVLKDPATYPFEVQGGAGKTDGVSTWANISDSRIKENVQTITGGLDKICQLRPVSFNFTEDYCHCFDAVHDTKNGFIAQEYETVFPDAVKVGGPLYGHEVVEEAVVDVDGEVIKKAVMNTIHDDLKSLGTHDVIIYSAAAIKELKEELDILKVRISTLEGST
jgi:hypothetical protein